MAVPDSIKSINFSITPTGGRRKKNAYKYKVTKQDREAGEKGFKFEADLINDGKPVHVIFDDKINLGEGVPQKKNPIANFTYSPLIINAGDTVSLDGSTSTDPDGTIASYLWSGATFENPAQQLTTFQFPLQGDQVTISLTVTDNDNLSNTKSVIIKKGEEPDSPTTGDKIILFADNDVTNGAEQVLTQIMKEQDVLQYCFVGDGPYSEEGTQWCNMMGEYFDEAKKDKLILSQGNHEDQESESEQTEQDIEEWYKRGLAESDWLSGKQVGNFYIISMNSQDLDIEFKRDQFNFVTAELQKAKQLRASGAIDWILVLFHKPFFTLKSSHSPYTAVRFIYKDIFRDAQVDFVNHGHNHNTQLWYPMIPNDSEANGEGTQLFEYMSDGKTFDFTKDHGQLYQINGHGGHEHNSINDSGTGVKNVQWYNDEDYGYTCMVINGKEVTVQAKDTSGNVMFQYKVSRGENIPQKKPPIVSIEYSPERPNAGQTVNLNGSKSTDPDGVIVTREWSGFDPIDVTPDGTLASFVFPPQGDSVAITLKLTDNDGLTNSRTVNIVKFKEEPLDAEAELLITKNVGDTVILNGSKSTGPIVSHEWRREDNSGLVIPLVQNPLKYSSQFIATAEMVDKDIKFRLRVFDANGNFNDDVGGTKVTIKAASSGGDIDQNGILWLDAKGKITLVPQSRDEATDDRWSENVPGCERGFEAVFIGKSIGTAGGGEAHFAMKQGGSNHSGSGASSQRWLDTGLRDDGTVQLQWEGPHPNNHDFSLPDSKWFIKKISKGLEGVWIGLKWHQRILKAGGSPADGGVRWRMWVDEDPLGPDGKPRNNWKLVYDFIDGVDAQVIQPQTYKMTGTMDAEVRRSDTEEHEVYAGGLHVRTLT